jgi:hypothetical protein
VQALISVGYTREQVHLHIIRHDGNHLQGHPQQAVGLNKRSAKTTCKQLHRHAALSVATNMRIKRAQESARQKQGVG